MNKSRLEAFTDAIIAIVLTLLVLDLPRPETGSLNSLLSEWQSIYVYIITFALLIAIWLNHHDLFIQVKKVNRSVFWANALWLLFQSFVPYMASWVTRFPNSRWPVLAYLLNGLAWLLSFLLLRMTLRRINPEIPAFPTSMLLIIFVGFAAIIAIIIVAPNLGLNLIPVHALISVLLASKYR
ncbi:DUF1211 domain-containing protein [Pediococcus argentinicus]|nr:DUF1211 domain-containing protein [Pediococcus argentinicus]